MNQKFRFALLRELSARAPEQVIDYTRYDLPAHEPQGLTRKFSLLGEINQKQTRPQDRPRSLHELLPEDRKRIQGMYPELSSGE